MPGYDSPTKQVFMKSISFSYTSPWWRSQKQSFAYTFQGYHGETIHIPGYEYIWDTQNEKCSNFTNICMIGWWPHKNTSKKAHNFMITCRQKGDVFNSKRLMKFTINEIEIQDNNLGDCINNIPQQPLTQKWLWILIHNQFGMSLTLFAYFWFFSYSIHQSALDYSILCWEIPANWRSLRLLSL